MWKLTMIPDLVRTPAQLRAAREFLELSADGLARMVGVEDGRTVRRWESGERELPGSVTVMVETALGYMRKLETISKQLDMFRSGKIYSFYTEIDGKSDIDCLLAAKKSYEEAFEILTRRPPPGGAAAREVHWYHLRRVTPKFDPARKDDWSLPGELSPEGALAYFEKHEGFDGGLELCENDDLRAEFTLEKKELVRRQYGVATQGLSAGNLVETFNVRRRKGAAASGA
jgi:hypothetical protein